MHTNGFKPRYMSAKTSHLYGFTEVIKFIARLVYIKNLLCKSCLYAIYSQLTLHTYVAITHAP